MRPRLAVGILLSLLASPPVAGQGQTPWMQRVLLQEDLDPGTPGVRSGLHSVRLDVLDENAAEVIIKATTSMMDVEEIRTENGALAGLRVALAVRDFKAKCWTLNYPADENWQRFAPFSYLYLYREPSIEALTYVDIWFYPPGLEGATVSSARTPGTLILRLKYDTIHR